MLIEAQIQKIRAIGQYLTPAHLILRFVKSHIKGHIIEVSISGLTDKEYAYCILHRALEP